MSEAATLRCPSCGAPVAGEAASCGHCHAPLHPIRCPWCFGWTFTEARDCGRCGSTALPPAEGRPPACPSCKVPLSARASGKARLAACARCSGIWADTDSFRAICADHESQTAYLGEGSILKGPAAADPKSSPIVYRPCAVCGELMNRFNFANCSGVILDACKPHGVWLDSDELRRIVAFIRAGGLDLARAKEKRGLELERRRLVQAARDPEQSSDPFPPRVPLSLVASRDLLRFLLGK